MIFNDHSKLAGCHAILSASQYHWLNYDMKKFDDVFRSNLAKARGTQLHEFASEAIKLRIKLKGTKQTLNLFVNDAIGFRMESEQVLYYSPNCFGTADAISYSEEKKFLRIHDLKTGSTPASFNQLKIYAALFCLEYKKKPAELGMELRIYQSDEVHIMIPEVDEIAHIMDLIITFDKRIEQLKKEES